MTHPLALTGERTLPGIPEEGYWFARHEAAYRWVATAFPDDLGSAVVIEAGAGEGYGAALLRAAGARTVVALDYDEASCAHAARAYPDIDVVRANLVGLPLRREAADVVVSLQVVEHLWDLPGFLSGCLRSLQPGGLLVLSTPNRLTFSPGLGRGERPTNPFHVEEFDAAQLAALMTDAGYERVSVHGLRHGAKLTAWEAEHGSLVAAQVQAVLAGTWPPAVLELVATVTAGDFEVGPVATAAAGAGDTDASLDLLVVARRPAVPR